LICGQFRTGQVRIGGMDFMPPKCADLEGIFNTELQQIMIIVKQKRI